MLNLRCLCLLLCQLQLCPAIEVGITIYNTHSGQPLILDSLRYQTSQKETYSISRLSYLLSEFQLENTKGKWIPVPNQVAWMDVANRRNQITLSNLPDDNYRALRFSIGLNEKLNHSDPSNYAARHPLNTSLNNLHWTWQTGYIFLALEGRYRDANNELKGFVYHYANDPQRTVITIPLPQNIEQSSALELDFDLAALLNAPIPISFIKEGASTHSRQGDPIIAMLRRNLPGAFQLKRIKSAAPRKAPAPITPIDLPQSPKPYPFKISRTLPIPDLPKDNPLIEERVELGRRLFHDPQLSLNNRIACASCHQKPYALADSRKQSLGINNQLSRRHSMPLFNLAWKNRFFWDGRAPSLREQVLMPIEDPTEMGESLERVIKKLKTDPHYSSLFANAFRSGDISAKNIGLAIENFLLTQTSYDSKFDQAIQGQASLTAKEQRGFQLFMTEFEPRSRQYGADCFHCHGGALFTDNRFHDNGLAPSNDLGLAEVTQATSDQYKFSTPSLRNVALTAPYMHDGRFETLEEVVEHYSSGIHQRETLDPNLAKHPETGLQLSTEDKAALVAFLKTLTDPQYSNSIDEKPVIRSDN